VPAAGPLWRSRFCAMDYPFPYFGAGPGISKHRWSVYVVLQHHPTPEVQAEIAASVPRIVAARIAWEGSLLECRSGEDVEYDVRLAAMEKAKSRAEAARYVEEAYDEASDSARAPKLKAWVAHCRAIDRWVAEMHQSQGVRFALKTLEKPASSWHQFGVERIDDAMAWLSEQLAAAGGTWGEGEGLPATARLASEVLRLVPGEALKREVTRDRVLAFARVVFDASHEVAMGAAHFIGRALAAAPPKARSAVLWAEVSRAHPSILPALAQPERKLRPAFDDAALTAPLLRAFSLAGKRQGWIASTVIEGCRNMTPPPPWLGDVLEALAPFERQPYLEGLALHVIPVAHAWSGQADKARATLPAALAAGPRFSARDEALKLCESLLAMATGPARDALAEVRDRFRAGT